MRELLAEIETKVAELVDLLNYPAGEYAPRARRILSELVDMVMRWLNAREAEDDEPTNPKMQRLVSAPRPPPVPRKRQETMELSIDDILFEEYERRRKR
jgi:hypothetical protein